MWNVVCIQAFSRRVVFDTDDKRQAEAKAQ